MKAVGYKKPLPISAAESLLDIEVPTPKANGRDVLVEVKAISVNPVDVKVRTSAAPEGTEYKILGVGRGRGGNGDGYRRQAL
jgi:NADPH2:quinone reductase